MRYAALWLLSLTGAAILAGASFAGDAPAAKSADGQPPAQQVTMNGTYYWGKDPQPIQVVFTRTPDGQWNAVFTCRHGDKPQTFRGAARGDLASGEVSGAARWGGTGRTWVYRGQVKDGVLKIKHFETSKGGEKPTGECTFTRVDAPASAPKQ